MKAKEMIICALFAAIISVTAPFSIPIGVVPVTVILFTIALTSFVGGSKISVVATMVYIALGLVGMPVCAGFKSALTNLMTPVGGFMLSYLFIAFLLGQSLKYEKKIMTVLFCAISLLVCYICGTVWYVFITKASVWTALVTCVLPFIAFDVIKIYLAYIVGGSIRKTLKKAKIL